MNDIFELEKEKNLKESKIRNRIDKIELLRSKLEPSATKLSNVSVQSSHNDPQKIDIYAEIFKMEQDIEEIQKELDIVIEDANRRNAIFKKFNDRDMKIYTEKRLLGYNNNKISYLNNGISKRQINKIIKKIRESSP